MKHRIWLLLLLSGIAIFAGSGCVNTPEQRDKPYLILVSIDGFRWDYQDLYDTPNLDHIAASGVKAERMIPVFPTLTFPNHYSIATGLYPANHRLIENQFPSKDRKRFYSLRDRESVHDASWYAGEPVWVAAERNGVISAAYFFVGTEAPINGIHPTYWHTFDHKIPGNDRVDQVIEWLSLPEDQRPHMITLYFEDVDSSTHRYGPGSDQSVAAIRQTDDYLGRLLAGVADLPVADHVYIIVVSDHGQSAIKQDAEPFILESVVSLDGLTVVDHGSSAFIYLPEPDPGRAITIRNAINNTWKHGKAMLREEAPDAWRATEEAGFAEIIVQADPQYLVFSSADRARNPSLGDHGWAPEFQDMHGIFLATGPRLPKGERIPAIDVIDVYPLMMEILELPVTKPVDGDPDILPSLLKRP